VEELTSEAPILEFDAERSAIIEPSALYPVLDNAPAAAVMTWMSDAVEQILAAHQHNELFRVTIESGDWPIYRVELPEGPVAITLSHVGAPAATLLYESLVAMGFQTIVAVGSSGGLVAEHPPATAEHPPATVVVPDAIIRAEGVSYHYAAAGRLAHPDPELQAALAAAYRELDLAVSTERLWTTDALFRETEATVEARIAEGAVAVDMEAAALATVATFRGVRHGHAVYMADTLHGDAWDPQLLIKRDTQYRYQLLLTAARVGAALR